MKNISGVLFLILISLGHQSFAQFVSEGEDIAFDGYDLTSYFEGVPVQGHKLISYQYQGMNLIFNTKENKKKFIDNPDKYIPAYGGCCATAVVHGSLVKPDFKLFKIQDEKLLFFEVKAFFNGQTQWEKDPGYHKLLADAQFKSLKE